MLPLAESTRIALAIREKLEVKHVVRHAVQHSRKHDVAIRERRRHDHRIILLVICTAGGVAVINWRWDGSSAATRSQCDSETTAAVQCVLMIVVNGVAENSPGSVMASEAGDADAVKVVKRNGVTLPGIRAADNPVRRIAGGDTTISVTQRHRAGDIGADLVALDDDSCRATADKDAVGTGSYHIGCTRCAAADGGVE